VSISEESGTTGKDAAAFVVACILGYLIGTLLPAGPWAIYTSVLVGYHLFLAWLVITADHEVGFSLPVVSTIVTHLACLGCVIAILLARRYIPFFRYFGMGIAGLAIFERGWLFVKTKKIESPAPIVPVMASTGDDYQEWMRLDWMNSPPIARTIAQEPSNFCLYISRSRPAELSVLPG